MTISPFRIIAIQEKVNNRSQQYELGSFKEQSYNNISNRSLSLNWGERLRLNVYNNQNQIIGSSSVVPTSLWLLNKEIPAVYWIEVYVQPRWRMLGIQRTMDSVVRNLEGLKLVFANKLAAPIYMKHGWSLRNDFGLMLLPLHPTKVPHVQDARGLKGLIFRFLSRLLMPAAFLYRFSLMQYKSVSSQILSNPTPEFLNEIYERYKDGWVTTNRSVEFIRWRYIMSPHRSEYDYFVGGTGTKSSLALISRTLTHGDEIVTRILDIFGDLEDRKSVSDLLRLCIREAIKKGSTQITALATNHEVKSVLQYNGFIISMPSRFGWDSKDRKVMDVIDKSRCHWVIGDSNKDPIE